jgi:hypothetical protein
MQPTGARLVVEERCSLPTTPGFEEHDGREILGKRAVADSPEAEPQNRWRVPFEEHTKRLAISLLRTPKQVGVGRFDARRGVHTR